MKRYELPPDPARMLEIAHRLRTDLARVDVGKCRGGWKTLIDCTAYAAGLAYDMERLLPVLNAASELRAALQSAIEYIEALDESLDPATEEPYSAPALREYRAAIAQAARQEGGAQ